VGKNLLAFEREAEIKECGLSGKKRLNRRVRRERRGKTEICGLGKKQKS